MKLLLFGVAVSFKKEISVVLISLGVIMSLPVIALFSVVDARAVSDPAVQLYTEPISVTAGYDYGFCTYWVALRREQTRQLIPKDWGNANTWAMNAKIAGYRVDHIASAGSIMQTTAGPLGHVAYVESIGADGSWTISEMNFKAWDIVDTRTFSAKAAKDYNFIH